MKSFCLLLLAFCLFSCSGSSDPSENKSDNHVSTDTLPKYDSSIEKGKAIPEIKCLKDSSVNYALYLPKKYSADEKFPVIFFFDSHGGGNFPLEKYKDLAEKYGYILAGSNNSKNGMSWEQNEQQIKIFMEDVKSKIHVDSRRIYACGFSGGSRVASSVAIFDGGINCVIGMGAGFPSLSEPIHNRFDYIGFAGNEDFNMNEMIELSASMDKSPIKHQLIVFNGKHEWAPAEVAEDAFVWLEVNAMRVGLISKNDSIIKNFISKNENELTRLQEKKKIHDVLLICKKVVNYMDGLAEVTQFKTKIEELNKSDDLTKEIDRQRNLSKEEMTRQENYRNNFVLKDLSWWTNEIKKLNKQTNNKNDEGQSQMNKRLLGYLSLLAYMNVSSVLESNQLDLAVSFLKIYEMVDPKNSEHQYLFAELYARKNDNAKALSSLKNALTLGFSDYARMESDSSLLVLQNNPDFQKILNEMKKK
ncbi:MAG: hypothetical protein HY841_05230 [Bacteroidetes bacterium]|nr:hypothetical protein [Bacteroidota bacterium]